MAGFPTELDIVDCHAEGEIGRVIVGGVPDIPGDTVFAKKLWLERNMDELRQFVLFEPRGVPWHNANIIVPACDPAAVYGYIIMESTEYPAMSGSNTICVATVLLETGMVPMVEPVTDVTLESAAGLITVRCDCANGKVTRVRFVNQPAFVYHRDATIDVPGVGDLRVDVAFGGMVYVLVEAADLGFSLVPAEARAICDLAETIKDAAAAQLQVEYPGNPDMPGITMVELMGPLSRRDGAVHAKNAVVVSPGRVDRSPCGTGTSARMALLHARGDLAVGQRFVHESLAGTFFDCAIDGLAQVGPYDAVIPAVAGQAWIYGRTRTSLAPTDPYPHGHALPDVWFDTSNLTGEKWRRIAADGRRAPGVAEPESRPPHDSRGPVTQT